MASPNLTEIAATTLRSRTGQLADNVSENVRIIKELKKAGRIKTVSGGRTILQELDYQENATYKRYTGAELLNIAASDTFSAAEFDWKQVAVAVILTGLEEVQNAGPEQSIDLLESRITNAERTMMNNLAGDCYSDGTADGGKQIGGLQLLIADLPTSGTVGGISRSTFTFWRNQFFRGVTDGGAAVSSTNIQSYMNQLYLRCSRNGDAPSLILADNNYYRFYWESLQAIQRINSDSEASAGYAVLKFMGANVYFDGGQGGSCPSNHMYFINPNYLHWRPSAKRNMKMLEGRNSINQDASVQLIVWAGNMTASNCALQGCLVA